MRVWLFSNDQIRVEKQDVFLTDPLKIVENLTLDQHLPKKELDFNNMLNPCEMIHKQREERRWCERLHHQAEKEVLAGKENKKSSGGKKRPISSNNISTFNSFSILDNDDIIDRMSNMGVPVSDSNYDSIDLLKEIENARDALIQKNELRKKNKFRCSFSP